MSDYYGILTTAGAAVCAQSVETGLEANISTFVIGDGNGSVPQPNAAQTELVNTVFTGQLNSLSRDKINPAILIAEAVLPASIGPFWIREMGIKTTDGTLVAVCSLPPQYKVATEEGASGTMVIKMNVIFTEGANVTLIVDDTAVLATRSYVDQAVSDEMAAHIAAEDPHPQYILETDADAKYLQISENLSEINEGGIDAQTSARMNIGITGEMLQGHFLKRTLIKYSGTFTPDEKARFLKVKIFGGGGAGGKAGAVYTDAHVSIATGGAGGAVSEVYRTTTGDSISVIVGAGGINGTGGGYSAFGADKAYGGNGGSSADTKPMSSAPIIKKSSPTPPNTSTGMIINTPATPPDDIVFFSTAAIFGGNGGASLFDSGGRLTSSFTPRTGYLGSGGSGAVNYSTTDAAYGGNGGDGMIIVEEYM